MNIIDVQIHDLMLRGWIVSTQSPLFPDYRTGFNSFSYTLCVARAEKDCQRLEAEGKTIELAVNDLLGMIQRLEAK